MSTRGLLRWGVLAVGLMAAGMFSGTAEAAPLVGQLNVAATVAPATVGFHRFHSRYTYRSWGGYNYGRPSLYYSCHSRPNRTVVRYNYRPSYSYGYVSPYVVNSYHVQPTCHDCVATPTVYSQPVVYNEPAVYSQPVIYTQPAVIYPRPIVYSQPVVYARPTYSMGVYNTGFSRPALYSGYSSYAYPSYGYSSFGYTGYGYPVGGAYYPGGRW
jgi:hypothetical protein